MQKRKGLPLSPLRQHDISKRGDRSHWVTCHREGCDNLMQPHRELCVRCNEAKNRFGMTTEGFLELYLPGVCEICGTSERLHIDHDHTCCSDAGKSCGKCIRGLLCSTCNWVLGQYGDDEELLYKAARYLAIKKEEKS